MQIHLNQPSGDILVFVSGTGEISRIIHAVHAAQHGQRTRFGGDDISRLECWPLSDKLSPEAQKDATESVPPASNDKTRGRNIFVATEIAERN